MNALTWFSRRRPQLSSAQQRRCAALPAPAINSHGSLLQQRLVILDLETSGLNTRRDQVLSIGAVAIEDGAIQFARQFECTLLRAQQQISASVLIHGLSPSTIAAGTDPCEALLGFMEFLDDSPVLAFHAGFDQRMLARALKESLQLRLRHPFFDVAELAALICPEANLRNAGLDDWISHFGLHVGQRHHASADALVTAELTLILLSRAQRQQIDSLQTLQQRLQQWRTRQQPPSL